MMFYGLIHVNELDAYISLSLVSCQALISNLGDDGAFNRGGAYLIYSKSWPEMIIFFNTSSARKQQHKLFIDLKS